MKKLRSRLMSWEALLVVLLLICCAVGSVVSPYFLTGFNFYALTSNIMEIAIMALPMTLIIIVGEIDLSVASVLGLSSVLLGVLTKAGWPIEAAFVVCLMVGLLCGAVNGFLVTVVGLPSLAVTIGTLALFRGIAVGLLGTTAVTEFPFFWQNLAQQRFGQIHIQRLGSVVLGIFAERACNDGGLLLDAGQPLFHQTASRRLHADHAAGQDQKRQGIEGENAPGEGGEVGHHYSL